MSDWTWLGWMGLGVVWLLSIGVGAAVLLAGLLVARWGLWLLVARARLRRVMAQALGCPCGCQDDPDRHDWGTSATTGEAA